MPELGTDQYPAPIVDHQLARERVLGLEGAWTRVGALFLDGHWPLAVLGDGRVLAY